MAGAGKKRAQKERQTSRLSPDSPNESNAPASGPPGGFDGPGDPSDDPSRGGSRPPPAYDQEHPPPAYGQQASHSRQSSNIPPGFGPSTGAPASSHDQPSGSSKAYAPINVGDVNRRLDLPGNAYNLSSEVSPFPFVVSSVLGLSSTIVNPSLITCRFLLPLLPVEALRAYNHIRCVIPLPYDSSIHSDQWLLSLPTA